MHRSVAATGLSGLCLASALVAGLAVAENETGTRSGQQLFEFHGCVNCHGAGGKEPVSKVVPELAGKPGDELYDKATKTYCCSVSRTASILRNASRAISRACFPTCGWRPWMP
jgi:cytochrome c2